MTITSRTPSRAKNGAANRRAACRDAPQAVGTGYRKVPDWIADRTAPLSEPTKSPSGGRR